MARPRKPLEILEASGAFDKNPQRRRPPPVRSNHPIGDPPRYLIKQEAEIWHELALDAPAGLLTGWDRNILGMFCQLEAKKRFGTINGIERGQLIKLYAVLAASPADRSRVSASPTGDDDNPFSEFAS